jgi:hypothetical protein
MRRYGHQAACHLTISARARRLRYECRKQAPSRATIDALLTRSADALAEIRGGIDAQAATVSAVAQSQAGIGQPGSTLPSCLANGWSVRMQRLTGVADCRTGRSSQRLMADLDTGLAALDDRFLDLARSGGGAPITSRRRLPGFVRSWRP